MTLVWRPGYTWNETIWNPSMITTALWLDAADASTVTESGGAVSQWDDKSGNSRHASQPTTAARPTWTANALNGLPVVTFDGSNDILGFSLRDLSRNVGTIGYFFVASASDPNSTGYRALFQCRTSTGVDRAVVYARNSTLEAGGRRLPSDSYQFHTSGSITNPSSFTGFALFNYTGATLEVGVNGSTPSSRPGGFQSAGNSEDTDSSSQSIGGGSSNSFSATASFPGYVAEFIAVTSTMSVLTRQRIEGYLAHKWGLTANLPSDHPYKTVGPTP